MAETHLDHPSEIKWFARQGPAKVIGSCSHSDCKHLDASTIAHGPDYAHYELHECMACKCRGWYGEYPALPNHGPRRVWPTEWLQVAQEVKS